VRRGLLLSFLVLAAGAPRSAAAQEPTDTTAVDTAAVETGTAPAPRARYVAPRLAFSLTFGTVGLGDLQRQPVRAEALNEAGGVASSETLERTLSAGDGLQVALSALAGLSPPWAVRVGASWARASLAADYSGAETFTDAVRSLPPSASPDLDIRTLEAALRFRMRSGRPFQPYAELGVGTVRMEAEDTAFTGESSLAGLVALGAVIPVRSVFAGRIQLSGHIFRTPVLPGPAGAEVVAGDTLRVTFREPEAGRFADPGPELTRTLRLDLGLVIELGSAMRPRGATADPTSGSLP
jgi:hypothetical protein